MNKAERNELIKAAHKVLLETDLNIIRLKKELHQQTQLSNLLTLELKKMIVEKYT